MNTRPVWKNAVVGGALVLALVASGCSVSQTEEGKLPDVKVTTTEGNLPKYDVDVADVELKKETKQVDLPDIDVGTETKTVEVPDVDVSQEKTNITVPDVDVTMPNEKSQ